MRRFTTAALLAASLYFAAAIGARAAIIDFGNTSNDPFSPTETYTEDGFQFTVVSGATWAIQNTAPIFGSPIGNPPSGLVAGANGAVGIGSTISVVRIGGGLFTFTAVDYAAFLVSDPQLSDGVSLVGFVGNVQTQIFSNLTSSQSAFQTLNPNFSAAIDELRIVGASEATTSLILDNFVLNEASTVPEPASIALLGAGLIGLAAARRRRAG